MLETIVIFIWLAALPILLWSIPKTRRSSRDVVLTLKTVPLGCLTALFVPTLLYSAIKFLNNICGFFSKQYMRTQLSLHFGLGILGFVLGIAVIVLLVKLLRKKDKQKNDFLWLPYPALFLFFAISTLMISVIMPLLEHGITGDYCGDWRTCSLPDESEVNVAFEERVIHPFLAEYDYRLRFRRNGKDEYRNLRMNTGGRTCFNIYRLQDGRLYFVDKDAGYIVNQKNNEVLYVFEAEGKQYAARYPRDSSDNFDSYGWTKNESGKVMFDGKEKVEAFQVKDELDGKIYYGCITDDFYPAPEKPEQTIDKQGKNNDKN